MLSWQWLFLKTIAPGGTLLLVLNKDAVNSPGMRQMGEWSDRGCQEGPQGDGPGRGL